MPGDLTPLDEDLLAALDAASIADHCARLTEALPSRDTPAAESGRDGKDRVAAYIRAAVRGWGVPLVLHRFEALVNVPGEARFTLARRNAPVAAIVHPWSAATPPDGLTAELRATGPDTLDDDDFAGCVALLDGPPTPALVAAVAARGAIGQVYVSPDETLRPVPVVPDGGDGIEAPAPVISIGHAAGEGFRALCAAGATPVRLRTSTAWRRRRLVVPVATVSGVEEAHDFVLVGAAGADWPSGVADAACLLELCRVLALHAGRLRRGVRLAWWPDSALPTTGAAWYADHAWEELGRHGITYVDLRGLGRGRGATWTIGSVPALQWLAEGALRDGGVARPVWTGRVPEGAASPFARRGLPALRLAADGEMAAGPGAGTAAGGDEAARLKTATGLHALILARLCTYPILPLDPAATARAIQGRVRAILEAAGDMAELGPLGDRTAAFRAAAERFGIAALHVAQATSTGYEEGLDSTNRALRRLDQALTPLLSHAGDPYSPTPGPDGGSPHLLPGLDPALALAALPPEPAERDELAAERLRLATVRERNRLLDALGAATAALDEGLAALRALGFG